MVHCNEVMSQIETKNIRGGAQGGLWPPPSSLNVSGPLRSRLLDAISFVEAFESVGVTAFDVTLTDQHRAKQAFKASRPIEGLRNAIASGFIQDCERRQRNIILRPTGNGPRLVQLDDLPKERTDLLSSFSFLSLETSPGNYQLWIAAIGISDDDARELKYSTGADPHASGAVRLAGSINFKEQYAPHFPTVRVLQAAQGHLVTADKLRTAGYISQSEPAETQKPPLGSQIRLELAKWPDYARCLADAGPARSHKGQDRSQADFNFAILAIERGFTEAEIAAEVMARSDKAKEKKGSGQAYAGYTARRAAEIVKTRKR